jgi:hypothetical protein
MSNDRQELIRQFAVAIAGAHQARSFRAFDVAIDEIWRIATSLADREPPQPEPQPEPEHTREDWWELEGDVKRLRKDVQRLSANTETLEGRIRRAVTMLRDATRYDRAQGYVVPEDAVDQAVQILEGQE